jgi:hypothetical protein
MSLMSIGTKMARNTRMKTAAAASTEKTTLKIMANIVWRIRRAATSFYKAALCDFRLWRQRYQLFHSPDMIWTAQLPSQAFFAIPTSQYPLIQQR